MISRLNALLWYNYRYWKTFCYSLCINTLKYAVENILLLLMHKHFEVRGQQRSTCCTLAVHARLACFVAPRPSAPVRPCVQMQRPFIPFFENTTFFVSVLLPVSDLLFSTAGSRLYISGISGSLRSGRACFPFVLLHQMSDQNNGG
jgi:hypothetical protein